MKTIGNLILISLLFGAFITPIVGMHMMVATDVVVGDVAGVKDLGPQEINIIPNLKDFNEYVEFNPQPMQDGVYTDEILITAFQRQRATYRGIYTVYNLDEHKSVAFHVVTPGIVNQEGSFERVMVSIQGDSEFSKLTEALLPGDTLVRVKNWEAYEESKYVWVGEELAQVVTLSTDGVVVTPLKDSHEVGEIVYPESIVITPQRSLYPQTGVTTLAPGERAMVNIEVNGTASLLDQDRKVGIPLEFIFTRL